MVSSTQQPAIETMEEEFYEKLDSITEINEDVKEYVTHFLEDAYSNIKFAARFGEVGNRSSVLGLTELCSAGFCWNSLVWAEMGWVWLERTGLG